MVWLGLAAIASIAILCEDFRWRMVHIYWYPLLLVGLIGLAVEKRTFADVFIDSAINLLFVLILLLLLTLYFSIKNRKLINLFDRYLGWGDVLFLLTIVVYFDLERYVLFTTGSLLLALVFTPLLFWAQGKEKHIPLAGIQAGCVLLIISLSYTGVWCIPSLLQELV